MRILIDIKLLKERLKAGGLAPREAYLYYLSESLLTTILAVGGSSLGWKWAAAQLVITWIGVTLLFERNGGAKGERFLERVFSICFVVTIRLLLLGTAAIVVFGIVVALLGSRGGGDARDLTELGGAFPVIISGFAFWRSYVHLGEVMDAA